MIKVVNLWDASFEQDVYIPINNRIQKAKIIKKVDEIRHKWSNGKAEPYQWRSVTVEYDKPNGGYWRQRIAFKSNRQVIVDENTNRV